VAIDGEGGAQTAQRRAVNEAPGRLAP